MIHIVFQPADAVALHGAFHLDEGLEGDILVFHDDLATGPLTGLDDEQGRSARHAWWQAVAGDLNLTNEAAADAEKARGLVDQLRDDTSLAAWIWIGPNAHDVTGYYWLVSQLQDFSGQVQVLFLGNLPFISEKGHVFYPQYLMELPPREFVKSKKLARPVGPSEFEIDPDEWRKLVSEGRPVRKLEAGKKLSQWDETFFDASLKKFLTGDWIRVVRVVQQLLAKSIHKTGDLFLIWRLREMARAGLIDMQGDQVKMRQPGTGEDFSPSVPRVV